MPQGKHNCITLIFSGCFVPTHPRRGAQVGTRAQRSLRIRMTITQERSPLALA